MLALVLASCGGSSERASRASATIELSIKADDGRGTVRRASLSCGDEHHGGRCAAAARLERFLLSKPDPRRACTEIYGGAETARISGTIGGQHVDRRFSRTNGCEIADWERAQALIPIEPSGPAPPAPPGQGSAGPSSGQ
jgi:hypothetical protein